MVETRMDQARGDSGEPFTIERIEQLVHTFYGRIREDALLGPIFDRRIEDWGPHLERMVLFWRAVLRTERTFSPSPKGAPPTLHRAMSELTLDHFQRWLALFGDVADAVFEPGAAQVPKEAAARIAFAFSRHLPVERHLSDAVDDDA